MSQYEAVDFLSLQDLLSDEEKKVQSSIRKFVSENYLPKVGEYYREGVFPKEIPQQLGDLGVLGCFIDGFGCSGLSYTEYGLIMMELERGDSGLRSFASVQSSLAMFAIHHFGSEEQKQKYLPQMAKGKLIGCFGLTEPDFGSNPSGMLSSAKEESDHFLLNGTKRWITNGSISDVSIVWAKLNERVQGFVVPKDAPGFRMLDIPGKLSLRASVTSELILEDCKISKDNILPEAKGLRAAFTCLNSARFGIVWGAIGAAMACYDEALRYAKERIMFDVPIAQKQIVQSKLVQMLNEISKAQLLAHRLGQLKDQNKITPQQISLGKMNNVKMALDCARTARDILGANGVSDEYQCMRHMCNLESVNTYEGTYDIHQLIVGEKITGLSAY